MSEATEENLPKVSWLENRIQFTAAIISIIVAVFVAGFYLAVYLRNVEHRLEKNEMKQEFNEKINMQIIKCQQEKQALENKRVENLEILVRELSNTLK